MSYQLWNDVSAARKTAGRLWTPLLTFDMMARDWGAVYVPSHTIITSTKTGITPTFQTWFSMVYTLPENMADDATFDSLRCYMQLNCTINANSNSVVIGPTPVGSSTQSAEVTVTTTPVELTLWQERDFPAVAVPHTITMTIRVKSDTGATSANAARLQTAAPQTYVEIRGV